MWCCLRKTASGLRIGTAATSGASQGLPVLANNVIPFDIAKNPPSLINWGDTANAKLLTALTLSITRQNTGPPPAFAPAASTKVTDVAEQETDRFIPCTTRSPVTGASCVGAMLQRGPKIGTCDMMTPTSLINSVKSFATVYRPHMNNYSWKRL